MKTLALMVIATVLLAYQPARAQLPTTEQQRNITTTWNQCRDSVIKENVLIEDLTRSFRLNPPWRVLDAREPERRSKIIDQLIANYRSRIKLLEKLQEQDK